MTRPSRSPLPLMAAGLVGLGAYAAATRPAALEASAGDAVRGAWVGVCLGPEALALVLLRRERGARSAAPRA